MFKGEEDNINILVLSPQIYPCFTGGFEVFNYHLISEFIDKGHEIKILTYCSKLENESIQVLMLHQNLIPLNCLQIFFNIFRLRSKIDLIYLPYTSNSPFVFPIILANYFFKIPYIFTIHGGGLYPWKHKRLQELFFNKSDTIIAVSDIIKKEYENRTNRNIVMIPPLIKFTESNLSKNQLRNKYGFDVKDKIIVSVGSLKRIKGNDILLNAFFQLGKDYLKKNGLKLIFVGSGPMRTELNDKVKNQGYTNFVKFTGNITQDKIHEVYKLADIFVISSKFEGTPIALLEALYNGLPVIGSDVTGINNIINDDIGFLFKKNNSNDLKEKIIRLIEDPDLIKQLGINSKAYSEKFCFEKMIRQYEDIFRSTING